MGNLFAASSAFVIIYSSDTDQNVTNQAIHVKHRKFTNWISINKPEWMLVEFIPNQYPVAKFGNEGSFADVFIYRKL
ncbi:MAG: hypothetical protein HIU83_18215 [Proteobacteria bacterium]|nr:hypothetical protein [Pseudomonadota bacterium]